MYNINKLFNIADKNLKVNTAYPIFKPEFRQYISDEDIFKNVSELSFYIHVPFCKQLCKFCEYTKFLSGNENAENKYLDLLEAQINIFLNDHNITRIYGFDIGGGTPTALSNKNFSRLIDIHKKLEDKFEKVFDYEKSIEISFSTIDEEKIKIISKANFNRVSAGIQSISKKLLDDNNRIYTQVEDIIKINKLLKKYNIEKLNLDLMYGLTNQDEETIDATLQAIKLINPEQVTLYETRFNRNNLDYSNISRDLQFKQYKQLYEGLISLGYFTPFGRNTFTKDKSKGVSSYLKYRMEDCIPYKGFGISAQSMSLNGLSYGILKNTDEIDMPKLNEIKEGVNYILPKEEIAAKYISIAMYNGSFKLDTLEKILGISPLLYYADEFVYIFENKLMYLDDDTMYFTEKGFRYYGAVSSLFWSKSQKNKLLEDKNE